MQRDGETADGHLRAIIAGGKDGYEIRLLLARSALGREQRDAARRELEAATRIDAETNAALLELLVNARRWDDAVGIGEMGTFVDPANGQVHRLLAQAYLEKNRNDDALYELDSALVVGHPQPGSVHLLRAHALHRLRRRNDAREAAQAARLVSHVSGVSECGTGSQRYWPKEITSGSTWGADFQ